MTVAVEKTVREVALENPGATRVLEKYGLDYCCGGHKPFDEACRQANLSPEELLNEIAHAAESRNNPPQEGDWRTGSLADLIQHIQSTHHKYTREEIARLKPLLAKVNSVHGKNHPELAVIVGAFEVLAQELTSHMMKEEMVLFPYIERMEEAVLQKEPILPPPFGSVRNPVTLMVHEHDSAGEALRAMREASRGYSAPAAACVSYQTLYKSLAEFEADLHQHIHLENNILFPRAIAMEAGR
jgi:regulator of cell morphogenesis and NO signaling